MKKQFIMMVLCAIALTLVFGATTFAADTYQLAIKGEKGKILKFTGDMGGALGFNLDGLPFPNAKMSGENIAAKMRVEAYFDTQDVSDTGTTFLIKLLVKNITLGNLLQLPDIGGMSKNAQPEMLLELSPQGGINNIEVHNLNLPGAAGGAMKGLIPGLDGMGMDLTSLDSILPMITGLIPPILPEDPVAVGDTWVQKVAQENMPMPIFPKLEVSYRLVSVDDDKAHLEFKCDGDYDAGFLNSFLSMMPQIPMGEDVMAIKNVDLKMKWNLAGAMDHLIGLGTIGNMDMSGKISIKGGAKIEFTHPDNTKEPWNPKLNGDVDLTGSLKYEGTVTRETLNELFPPAEPEAVEEEAPAAPAKPAPKKSAKPAKKPAPKPKAKK